MDTTFFDNAAGYLPDEFFTSPPDLGIVLGSGWSEAIKADKVLQKISYQDIPGLGAPTVKGHAGEVILFERNGRRVVAWCGRRHYYEGARWESVVMGVEILRRMGGTKLLLTNAAGGINSALRPGDFVIIRDHLNFLQDNPLIGSHNEEWGTRFPDMTEVYAKHFVDLLHSIANRRGLRVMDGIYACTTGPCYETPAEIQAYKRLGADVVGMSTVPEAIFAHACGIKTAGLSLVTNLAAGIGIRPLAHDEVVAAADAAKDVMATLIDDFISLV